MTNRPIKGVGKHELHMIPFSLTNHGTGENIYMYVIKKKWKKGADRLCSALYNVIRRIKVRDATGFSIEQAQKVSRQLVLMADNYSENKNNVVFAFCSYRPLRIIIFAALFIDGTR